jgi:hypothetical protein
MYSNFDSILGQFFIFLGALVLGYVILNLLYWIFLTILGIFFISWGMRLRRRAYLFSWLFQKLMR